MVPITILETYHAKLKTYAKDNLVFNESDTARFYYQIAQGSVKMSNYTEDGKEFIQGIFYDGQAFGEPPLFGEFKYPASALCVTNTELYVLRKATFLQLLKEHPDIHLQFTTQLSKRMMYKAKIMKEVSIYPPEHRIMTLLEHLKQNANEDHSEYEVQLTRQEISNLTGLRVETVIRSIKQLEKRNLLSIRDRKVFL